MKRLGAILLTIACTILLSTPLLAREIQGVPKTSSVSKGSTTNKTGVADCAPAESQFTMEINNVRTRLLNGGDLWWDLADAQYEIPKIDPPGSAPSVHALFAGALWISGIDDANNLKLAAQTYRQGGNDFWPGPIDANGNADNETCASYDQHFSVFGTQIDYAIAQFQANGTVAVGDLEKNAPTVLKWPAKGNSYLLSKEGINVTTNLAPFKDTDGDGIYDPTKGDYPVINASGSDAYADQMIFWVYNDVGNIHTETSGEAIGIQVDALAFGFQTSDELNNMTFYRYTMTNKSNNRLKETYMGQWVDPDLGCFNDDYVGCDTAAELGIVYNGDGVDEDCQSLGYGTDLPMLGVDYFEGPIDTAGNELGMSSFIYYNNDFSNQGNPQVASQFRNYQTGFWRDGNPIEFGGDGYLEGTFAFPYMYLNDPSTGYWSECDIDNAGTSNPPADRRFLQNSGPFVLEPGAIQNITIGVVFVQPDGIGACPSFQPLLDADVKAQNLFDLNFELIAGPDAPNVNIREMENKLIISLTNPPTSNNVGENYTGVVQDAVNAASPDSLYKFEGYIVYQLKNGDVSADEFTDPTKARVIYQGDINNGISTIINYETFDLNGADNAYLAVSGADEGIIRSFEVVNDAFAEGDPKLVNHKTYYFSAVAYAYNNWKEFDPQNPTAGGQKEAFKQGQKNVKRYSAIPHITDPRNEGTVLNSEYGQGVVVTRIEGQGNGGNNIIIDQASEDKILASNENKYDSLKYLAGSDPIGVKVIDPFKVQNVKYEFEFVDPTAVNGQLTDSATWELKIKDQSGNEIETIVSDRIIDRPYEQIIEEYGISITVGNPVPVGTNEETGNAFYGYVGSSIEYMDPLNPWLQFVEDDGINAAENWVRSGEFSFSADGNPTSEVFNDASYEDPGGTVYFHDPTEEFERVLDGGFAPYCLSANYSNPNPQNNSPAFVYGPGFKWNAYNLNEAPKSNLEELASIDIVFTSDKSKWSRCLVFETGEDIALTEGDLRMPSGNIGGARKGQIRNKISINENGAEISFELDNGGFPDTGRSFFPGYAINVETGERLNIAFGEASSDPANNGRDMIWNPTEVGYHPVQFYGYSAPRRVPIFGGKHFLYVFKTAYDECRNHQRKLLTNYNEVFGLNNQLPGPMRTFYNDIIFAGTPYLAEGASLTSLQDGLIPNETRVRIRVEKPYSRYLTTASNSDNDSLPKYIFNTIGLSPSEGVAAIADSALDLINVVPNPYYAYSSYETNQLDNKVKITNLPNNCIISIFSIDGKLIRRIERNIDANTDISEGRATDAGVNFDNSVEWDLKNHVNIPIASGVYLIHVEAPGIGEKVVKWFGALRPTDIDSF